MGRYDAARLVISGISARRARKRFYGPNERNEPADARPAEQERYQRNSNGVRMTANKSDTDGDEIKAKHGKADADYSEQADASNGRASFFCGILLLLGHRLLTMGCQRQSKNA